ncbi:MAG: hypothetical protein FJX29_03980 [Alphaproteobacteria bacterium]|nr:hypothetical protein [Alphaproteobacteria bacterium]
MISAATLLPSQGFAQQGERGIAFVVAPEQAEGVCYGGTPGQALDCARKKCTQGGAAENDCARIAWCFPSGWSAFMGVRSKDFSYPRAICGAPSRRALEATARAWCQDSPGAVECAIGEIWTPDGKSIEASFTARPRR